MPYPVPITQRFEVTLKTMQRQIKRLQARTAAIDSGFPLAALPGVVNPAYTSGNPTVQINGAVDDTGAPVYTACQHLNTYVPAAGDPVLLIPVGVTSTYIAIGKIA